MADCVFDCRTNRNPAENKAIISVMKNTQLDYHKIIQRVLYDVSLLSASEILELQSMLGNQKLTGLLNMMPPLSEGSENLSTGQIRAHARNGIQTQTTDLPYANKIQKDFGKHDISSIKAHLGSGATYQSFLPGIGGPEGWRTMVDVIDGTVPV